MNSQSIQKKNAINCAIDFQSNERMSVCECMRVHKLKFIIPASMYAGYELFTSSAHATKYMIADH